jgi:uncharacterized protein (DUF2147 family)
MTRPFTQEPPARSLACSWPRRAAALLACCAAAAAPARAQQAPAPPAEPVHGLWLAAQKDGVVEFKPCADEPAALCGTVVWDKDAGPGKPGDCGVRIAKLRRKEDGVWRDGWVFDPRAKKNYKGALRLKGPVLNLRAYIGTELLGQTEEMTRVDAVPPGCPSAPA